MSVINIILLLAGLTFISGINAVISFFRYTNNKNSSNKKYWEYSSVVLALLGFSTMFLMFYKV